MRIYPQRKMKRFFLPQHESRARALRALASGLSDRRAAELQRAYEEIVAGLEADGVVCAPLLRRTLDRSRRFRAGRMTRSRRSSPATGARCGCRRDGPEAARARLRRWDRAQRHDGARRAPRPALALRDVPIECRFHCNPNGLADVVSGRATPEEFVRQAQDLLVAPREDRLPGHRAQRASPAGRGWALAGAPAPGARAREEVAGPRTASDHRPRSLRRRRSRASSDAHASDLLEASRRSLLRPARAGA